nr:ABC transporter transmembrane domain-containing protein [Rhodoluna limnophila]
MLSSLSTVVVAWNLAWFVSQIFVESMPLSEVTDNLWFALWAGLTRALVAWVQEFIAQRAANLVKQELRKKYFSAVVKLGPAWIAQQRIATVSTSATSGLDALDAYFAKYLPQLVYTALITPILIVLISVADLASGIVVLLTLPLIPLFMVLIGWATKSVQQNQYEALNRLTGHFLEVMRGLGTLRVFGRAQMQVTKIAEVSEQYRERAMKVLRVSFLSGFALELLASLSVALIAVSIGLRLVNGEISLLIGLFVLILAPEAYLPIRQVGVNFHAAAEGVTSSGVVLDAIDASKDAREASSLPQRTFSPGKLTVIIGPSGSGKSTLLRSIIGIDDPGQPSALSSSSWVPQRTMLLEGNVETNIIGPTPKDFESVNQPALVQSLMLAALDDLELTSVIGPNGQGVSGGQAQRIALARAFYRSLNQQTPILVLDEPISALDSLRATRVIESLGWFAQRGYTVIAASHQSALIAAADEIVEVTGA